MQEPYHIKVSLQQYYSLFKSGEWEIPDFSDKCLICGEANCAKYHGNYERRAICPQTGFDVPDLPVGRFLCNAKGMRKNCEHVTFSLLPLVLVPYRQLPLKFMILALWLRLSNKLSLFDAMDAIEEELVNFEERYCRLCEHRCSIRMGKDDKSWILSLCREQYVKSRTVFNNEKSA